jgi:TRAP transporter TAXI family solute receptor
MSDSRTELHDERDRRRLLWPAAILLAVLAAAAIVAVFWQPAPPKRVVMSTGAEGGAYRLFAERYRVHLARFGVELELRPSSGAVENLERLRAPRDAPAAVDVAIVQGGLARRDEDTLVSLGNLFLEPLWLFAAKAQPIRDIRDLAGLRVAVGAPGSGTREVALSALKLHAIDRPPTQIVEIGGEEAERALLSGRIDAAIYVAAPDSPLVLRLVRDLSVRLVGLARADAYARRYPALTKVVLFAGVVDPPADLPPEDVPMVSTTAMLLARDDLHPVIVDLLVEATRQVHRGGSVLNAPGAFPNPSANAFPVSPEAERYHREGPGVLRRWLPLHVAVWVQRLLLVGIPLFAVFAPLIHFAPIVWRWQMRRRIYRWYGELKLIERAIGERRGDPAEQLERLDRIEDRLRRLRLPNAFGADLYALRTHILLVRDLLARSEAGAGAGPRGVLPRSGGA